MGIDYYPPLSPALGAGNVSLLGPNAGSVGSSVLINGAYDVWQRGTSVPTTPGNSRDYGPDRWMLQRGGAVANCSMSQQTTGIVGIPYCCRLQRTPGDTSQQYLSYFQSVENLLSFPVIGTNLIISCLVRLGAAFSASALEMQLFYSTGSNQGIFGGSGATGLTGLTAFAIPPSTTTFLLGIASAYVPTNATQIHVGFSWTPNNTNAGASDYADITAVQCYAGSVYTPFSGNTFDTQLARCQRYFQKSFSYATAPAQNAGYSGSAALTAVIAGVHANASSLRFMTPFRTSPTMIFYNPAAANAKWRNTTSAADSGVASAVNLSEYGGTFVNPQIAADGASNNFAVNWAASAEL